MKKIVLLAVIFYVLPGMITAGIDDHSVTAFDGKIWTAEDPLGGILIFLQESNSRAMCESFIGTVFLFQTDEPIDPFFFGLSLDDAFIKATNRSISISAPGLPATLRLVLWDMEDDGRPPAREEKAAGRDSTILYGYGISVSNGRWPLQTAPAHRRPGTILHGISLYCTFEDGTATIFTDPAYQAAGKQKLMAVVKCTGECDSGGEGATSCSITYSGDSCSVSCSAQSWACCSTYPAGTPRVKCRCCK